MKHKKITLPNGVRVIYVPTKGNPSATIVVGTEVGSKYETKAQSGLSHFLEHMLFKGTPKRPTSKIINEELDSLGAVSNAMTNEEGTVYYAKAEKKHWKKILDVLSDMYLHPKFPKEDLEKERGVILQEISMYEDQPQDKVSVLFQSLLYGDTPVGRWIAGTKESVSKLKHQDFLDYHKKHYTSQNTFIVIAGDIKEAELKSEVTKLFGKMPKGAKSKKDKVVETQTKPKVLVLNKKTDQSHMVLGFRTFKSSDKRQAVLVVLSTILGRGMSSRLWHKLREELGACYYVYAHTNNFTDHGYFAISTGIEAKRVEEIIKVLLSECKKLTQDLVGDEELKKAKDYMVGHLYLGHETTSSLAMLCVSQEVQDKGKLKNLEDIEREIRAVKAQDLKKMAQAIFKKESLNVALVGDVNDSSRLEKLLVI